MKLFDLIDQLEPRLRKGQIDACLEEAVKELNKLPETPFHIVHKLHFTNKPSKIAEYFNRFIRQEKDRIAIKTLYAELNGFSVNPDRWYFDVFAYENYEGRDDYDWLADWNSGEFPECKLTGMKKLQTVYDSEAIDEPDFDDAEELCSLIVLLKFQQLISSSAKLIKNLQVPILATAHDWDFIYEFVPDAISKKGKPKIFKKKAKYRTLPVSKNQVLKKLFEPRFERLEPPSEGLCLASLDGKSGYVDKHGITQIPFRFGYAKSFSNGRAVILQDGKYGFIDKNGEIAIKPIFEDVKSYKNEGAPAKSNGLWGIIDKDGEWLHPPAFDYLDATEKPNHTQDIFIVH